MRSSFFEFHVAASGLFTAKGNLAVAGHNISNAATPGYSRQIARQRADVPLPDYNGRGMIGTGSVIYATDQIREVFLDTKYWSVRGAQGEYDGKSSQLTMMENVFNEMGDSDGLSHAINEFFAKAADLSTTANDSTYRINFIQTANSLAEMIQSQAKELQKQQRDANTELAILVEQINSLGLEITSLNKQIATIEIDGSKANDLRDERARLVDDLSLLVNVDVREMDYTRHNGRPDKRFTVLINGYDFVNHLDTNTLAVHERDSLEKRNPMDGEGLYDITFGLSQAPFSLYHPNLQGQLKGIIDIRDGNGAAAVAGSLPTVAYKGIPYYMDRLNLMVRTLARAVDLGEYPNGTAIPGVTGHVDGFNLDGDNLEMLLFTHSGSTSPQTLPANVDDFYNDLNCLNFIVNEPLKKEPRLLSCASEATRGESAYDVIKSFSLINNNASLFNEGKLLDFVSSLGSEMGIDAAQAAKFKANYNDVVTTIDNQRIAVSGVDLNEEMITMIQNQQAYQAAAKMVNTINGIYDFLINRMGA
jgi:flagellar hook-associated protein 1 FlgK